MAGIDTSIYGQVAPPPDPFAIPSKIIGLSQAQTENQLLQRRLQGDQARQDALSSAYNPLTGQLDQAEYIRRVQGTPGALQIADDLQSGQGVAKGALGVTGMKQDLYNSQVKNLGQALGAAQLSNPKFGYGDAVDVALGMVKRNQIGWDVAQDYLHSLPRDDAGARKHSNGLAVYSMPEAGGGSPVQIGTDAKGAAKMALPGQFRTLAVGANKPAPAPTVAPAPTSGTGKVSAASPSDAEPTMGVVTGLPPGQAGASETAGRVSAERAGDLMKAADATSNARATLSEMESILPDIVTGPKTGVINTGKALINAGVDAAVGKDVGPRFSQEHVAKMERFNKLSGQLIAQQQQALGGTDAGFAIGHATNPNSDISTRGNQEIIPLLKGNQDAIDVKHSAWQNWLKAGHGPDTYGQFLEEFNPTFSPRAFQWVHMTPEQQQQEKKGMAPADKAALASALENAAARGWINKPGAAAKDATKKTRGSVTVGPGDE